MADKNERRKEISDLSDADLIDELQRPTRDWQQDVLRESVMRILSKLTQSEEKGK